MRVNIKNMVCPVYLYFVKKELARHGISYKTLLKDEIEMSENVSEAKLNQLNIALLPFGFEIQYDERSIIVLKIKAAINNYLSSSEVYMKMDLRRYISQKFNNPYFNLDSIFLEETGITIEKFLTSKKIEHAIKLLIHYNLTITEIFYQLNFENEEELISQFKSITGLTPDLYKLVNYDKQNVKATALV